MLFLHLSYLLAAAQAASIKARSPYMVKEVHNAPQAWERVGPAPKNHIIHLNIGLKQSKFDELERHLYEVSDPAHARYGQHLSADEVNELVKPSDEALDSTLEWLAGAGIAAEKLSFSPAKDWVKVSLPVEEVERLLDTEYSIFQHKAEGHSLVRTPKWSLPMHLHEHITVVQPTNTFMRPMAQRSNLVRIKKEDVATAPFKPQFKATDATLPYPDTSGVCSATEVTPACLRTLYGTIDYTPQVPTQNAIALNNFLGEIQARSDLRLFLERFRPDAVSAADTFTNVVINGGPPDEETLNRTQIQAESGLEGSLDIDTIVGITFPTNVTAYSTGGSPPFIPDEVTPTDTNEPYLDWVQFALAQPTLPQTISTSYGDDEQTVPQSYATQVCNLFAQFGARGVTSLHSSGDSGVGSNGSCVSNDGTNTKEFLPAFPVSCPFVTAVGATMNFGPEVVAFDPRNGFASGGGFSNYFATPSYQQATVSAYVAGLDGEFDGFYNKSGRAYPDIAAQGVAFAVEWDAQVVLLDGTSAACPTAASVISLLNDALIASGKPPLGFLNPLLYSSLNAGFHDVVSGSAIGCSEIGNGEGFPAKTGWDPVTGWGTPDFPVLKDLLVSTTSKAKAKSFKSKLAM